MLKAKRCAGSSNSLSEGLPDHECGEQQLLLLDPIGSQAPRSKSQEVLAESQPPTPDALDTAAFSERVDPALSDEVCSATS